MISIMNIAIDGICLSVIDEMVFQVEKSIDETNQNSDNNIQKVEEPIIQQNGYVYNLHEGNDLYPYYKLSTGKFFKISQYITIIQLISIADQSLVITEDEFENVKKIIDRSNKEVMLQKFITILKEVKKNQVAILNRLDILESASNENLLNSNFIRENMVVNSSCVDNNNIAVNTVNNSEGSVMEIFKRIDENIMFFNEPPKSEYFSTRSNLQRDDWKEELAVQNKNVPKRAKIRVGLSKRKVGRDSAK